MSREHIKLGDVMFTIGAEEPKHKESTVFMREIIALTPGTGVDVFKNKVVFNALWNFLSRSGVEHPIILMKKDEITGGVAGTVSYNKKY